MNRVLLPHKRIVSNVVDSNCQHLSSQCDSVDYVILTMDDLAVDGEYRVVRYAVIESGKNKTSGFVHVVKSGKVPSLASEAAIGGRHRVAFANHRPGWRRCRLAVDH